MRPVKVGTPSDSPGSLRRKAHEFLRLADEARDPVIVEELRRLAALYAEQAAEFEARATAAVTAEKTPEPPAS